MMMLWSSLSFSCCCFLLLLVWLPCSTTSFVLPTTTSSTTTTTTKKNALLNHIILFYTNNDDNTYNHNDDNDDEKKNLNPIVSKNKARTDLRNFLTQRSIQSFVYLLNQVHDVHTRNWIEQVVDVQQLDGYHGTGALNMTRFPSWDSFFLEIITMEKETIVIERQDSSSKSQQTNNDNNKNWANKGGYLDHLNTKTSLSKQTSSTSTSTSKPRSTRGSSSNYLANLGQQAQEPKKYTANEKKKMKKPSPFLKPKWQPGQPSQTTTTTTTTKNSNNSYLESLNANATAAETNKNVSFETTNTNKAKSKSKTSTQPKTIQTYEIDVDPASLVHRLIAVREQLSKEWVQDLETMYSTNDEILNQYLEKQLEARKSSSSRTPKDKDDEEDKDDDDDDDETIMNTKPHALFNNSIVMLANSIANGDRESSPFRRSNFDLLLLLSTQESVHRVLQEYQDEGETANFDWLKAFYTKRVAKVFDGHGIEYGRADEFLEELLVAPPTAQRTNNKEGVRFIDPMAMVEDIIRERSEVAREWKDIASEIPSDHTDLRRLLLTRRMMEVDGVPSFFKSSSTSTESKTKKTEEEDLFKEAGAFE